MPRIILLTGFAPFGDERSTPSWEVASQLEGRKFNGLAVKSMRLPVNCRRASQAVIDAITTIAPAAVVGLGQAGGRPTLSLEKVAINIVQVSAMHHTFMTGWWSSPTDRRRATSMGPLLRVESSSTSAD